VRCLCAGRETGGSEEQRRIGGCISRGFPAKSSRLKIAYIQSLYAVQQGGTLKYAQAVTPDLGVERMKPIMAAQPSSAYTRNLRKPADTRDNVRVVLN
jgi:hypothetical protein